MGVVNNSLLQNWTKDAAVPCNLMAKVVMRTMIKVIILWNRSIGRGGFNICKNC